MSAPTVITLAVTDPTQTTATGNGNVTDDGGSPITERGVCWGTNHNPDLNGSFNSCPTNGTGTYTVSMTGLTPGTLYYVRAYARNSAGLSYAENEVSFTTGAQQYTITTSVNPSNSGNVTGGGTYNHGDQCTLTATANNNAQYEFDHWTKNGASYSGGATITFNVTESATYTAYFHLKQYTITTQVSPPNSGTVIGGGTYNYGTNISLTATANAGYTFDHWQDNVTTNPRPITVTGDATYTAYFEAQPQVPEGAINGLFTINANGDQVYFSNGNLQYIGSASTPYWKFADNQWDYLGDNGQGSTSQTVDRDLFGWGTSGYNHGAMCYQPWSTSQNHSDYYAYANPNYNLFDQTGQADWGYNAISNGGNTINTWRTLTAGEWSYVIQGRSGASSKYGGGCVYFTGEMIQLCGLILLPDNWTLPSGLSFSPGNNLDNYYTPDQWGLMEGNGAVFLPAAGYRGETWVDNGAGVYGWYWSASCTGGSEAFVMDFGGFTYNYGVEPNGTALREAGYSVRLVRSAQ